MKLSAYHRSLIRLLLVSALALAATGCTITGSISI